MNKLGKVFLCTSLATMVFTSTALAKTATKPSNTTLNTTSSKAWSYKGDTGPDFWIEDGFITGGQEQSPINIKKSNVVKKGKVDKVTINYGIDSIKEFNNGHTVEAIPETKNNTVVINGVTYTLAQFHFHTPSEHEIDGKLYDMELHFVNKDANGNIAVLGLLIKQGKDNVNLDNMWSKLPTSTISEEDAISVSGKINLTNLLPENKAKYQYEGSLTTPPCTEGVKWYVFKTPIEMSKAQIETFKKIFPDDHRPVQPVNDRTVYLNKK